VAQWRTSRGRVSIDIELVSLGTAPRRTGQLTGSL